MTTCGGKLVKCPALKAFDKLKGGGCGVQWEINILGMGSNFSAVSAEEFWSRVFV